MLSDGAKKAFSDLGCQFQPIAIKYCFARPEGLKKAEGCRSLCQFVKLAQDTGEEFYIDVDNENCFGKVVLGMVPKQPFAASGQAGYDFEVYKTPAPNARIHHEIPTMTADSVNYVIFSPVSTCSFDPDLIIVVANTRQADIVMRASSYVSGDFWESKTSSVLSCGWTYVYPLLSGKINFCITGMHHGMRRRSVYPEGLHIIAIPFQKLPEVCASLQEMPWEPIAFRTDDESRTELARRMAVWAEMEAGQMPPADVN